MNHKYIALTSMYRYGILYMEDKPTAEQIRHTLTTINPHTVIPGSKIIVKKALHDNFGVKSKASMEEVIEDLMYGVWVYSIIYTALIDLFLNDPDGFTSVSKEQAEEFFLEKNRMQTYQEKIFAAWKIHGSKVDQTELIKRSKESIQDYFTPNHRHLLESLEEIFQKNKSWLAYTENLSMSAFQISRVISILVDACICGYITEEETEKRLNYYGAIAENLFKKWETFLFSAILGKQLMAGASGTFIIESKDYIQSCYRLAVHPAKILELSGLWAGSDLTRFCTCMETVYDVSLPEGERELGESDPKLVFMQSVVLPIFEKYEVGYLFDQAACEYAYTVPFADTTSKHYMMEYDLKKTKFTYDDDEIPFMVNGKSLLVTNKRIYIMEKKFLFFNKKTHIFNWTDKLRFSYKFSKLELVLFMVNDIVMFTFPRNYQKFGMGMMSDSQLDKKEVLEHYGADIENALLAFAELNEVLGKQP